MDADLRVLMERWNKWDKNGKTKAEIEQLLRSNNFEALKKCMIGKVSFGTAGMRSRMEAGFNRLNDLTIIQTAQGMLRYIQKVFSAEELISKGVVIGYDARHNSQRFAQLFANIFIRDSVKVHLFSKIVPTPLVSFSVIKFKCLAGIMITASHNPREDNGLKIFWTNGAQILSPHDTGICSATMENMEPWSSSWDVSENFLKTYYVDPWKEALDDYSTFACVYNYHHQLNEKCPLKFTYTPVHGVGGHYTPALLREFGFQEQNIHLVKIQFDPDPSFPTTPFPNPEEGEKVLKYAFETAEANNSTIVLANDPDADRFQLAERQNDGSWKVFSGNEIGGLLAWWLWNCWRINHPDDIAENVYMINSVVSSRIVASIAKIEGFKHEETLTGFKWMANRAHELKMQGKCVLLCWEESIGYMPEGPAFDKDGVLTAALFAEYASYLQSVNRTFSSQLNFLYEKYGHHISYNSYYINKDPQVMKKIFDRLRSYNGEKSYPNMCSIFKIQFVRDLTIGYDNSQPMNKPILPVSSASQMITFTLENGHVLTLRASGTEPKIKFYIEIIVRGQENVLNAEKDLTEIKKAVDEYLQPEINKLEAKSL